MHYDNDKKDIINFCDFTETAQLLCDDVEMKPIIASIIKHLDNIESKIKDLLKNN